jgi:hypothetical protein
VLGICANRNSEAGAASTEFSSDDRCVGTSAQRVRDVITCISD